MNHQICGEEEIVGLHEVTVSQEANYGKWGRDLHELYLPESSSKQFVHVNNMYDMTPLFMIDMRVRRSLPFACRVG